MRARPASKRLLGAILLCSSLGAGVATAEEDSKRACIAAHDAAQALRGEGKLTAAREQLARCSRDDCPKLVRQDCSGWMDEVVAALPSVVVGARDASGRDLVSVRVLIDGKLVAERLDGRPLLVDPGVHTFRYEPERGEAIEEQVVVRAGEKNRALTVSFEAIGRGTPVRTKPKTISSEPAPAAADEGPPLVAYVLGGVGIVALGAAAYLDWTANDEVVHLRDTCAPTCAESKVDAVRTRYTIAAVSAGVGAVSLGVAAYLFLSAGGSEKPRAGSLRFDVSPEPRGASAALVGSF